MKKVVISVLVAAVAVMSSCSSEQAVGVSKGNPSKLDSLSYAFGANIGYSVSTHMADIPFDYEVIAEAISETADGKGEMSHPEALAMLEDYFRNQRSTRAAIVAQKRAEADSIAIANGADEQSVKAARATLKADADMFESEEQRRDNSYAFGVDLCNNIINAELPIQTYWFNKAMIEARDGKATMDENASMMYIQNYFSVVFPAERLALSEKKLAQVEKKSGVQKRESGLLYRIEKEGDSDVIALDPRDVVKVHYTGRLLRNDKVFDSSRFADRPEAQQEQILARNPDGVTDEPIEFSLSGVIPGWTEGLTLVGKGGRISLWMPASLAYGAQGTGRDIGPNDALFFDVEVVDVIPYEKPEAAEAE